jgi:hypothetical protein
VRRLLVFLRVLLLEPFDTPFGIDDLLRAGKKRMAIGADIDTDVADGTPRFERIAARAMDCGFSINWMNTLLHGLDHSLPKPTVHSACTALGKKSPLYPKREGRNKRRLAIHRLQEFLISFGATDFVH